MFERYTEKARRVIFFARYEASQFGSSYIESEHLPLGLAREDASLRTQLSEVGAGLESLRKEIEAQSPPGEKISVSVDLPLSGELKRALVYASDEAVSLQHVVIDCGHLVLGLLRLKDCFAAGLLQQHGIVYDNYLEIVRKPIISPPASERARFQPERRVRRPAGWPEMELRTPAALSLEPSVEAFKNLLARAINLLDVSAHGYGEKRLKRKPWSRKEAFGHLIDLATAHHQWFARALIESGVTAAAAPSDELVQAQHYQSLSWPDIAELWISMNCLVLNVVLLVPEEKVNIPCRIGIAEPIPLSKLIEQYVEECEDLIGQILSRL